jgi:uncharacterized protein
VAAGAQVDARFTGPHAETALHRAASSDDVAALGLHDRVQAYLDAVPPPDTDAITAAFWGACHGDQQYIAEQLLEHGADLNWVGADQLTPLDEAIRGDANRLARWLRGKGARTAAEIREHDAGENSPPESDTPE